MNKNLIRLMPMFLKSIGFAYFVLRGFISFVSSDGVVTDIFGLPLLDPNQQVGGLSLILSYIGAVLPFVFIGLGMYLEKKIKER